MLASDRQTPENISEHQVLSLELEKLYYDVSEYWQQQSKTEQMREGDRNTTFFHAKATKRAQVSSERFERQKWSLMSNQRACGENSEGVFLGAFQIHQYRGAGNGCGFECNRTKADGRGEPNSTLPFTSNEVIAALSSMSPLKPHSPFYY